MCPACLPALSVLATPSSPTHTHAQASIPLHAMPLAAVRFPHMWGQDGVISSSGHPLASYCGLQAGSGHRGTLLTLRDPGRWVPNQTGPTVGKGEEGKGVETMAVQTWYGRRCVSVEQYRAALASMRPSLAVSWHDEVPLGAGNNRRAAALERSLAWLQESVVGSGSPSPVPLLAYLPCPREEGGVRAAVLTKWLPTVQQGMQEGTVVGVALGQLYLGESEQERQSTLSSLLPLLPPTLARLLPGPSSLLHMLAAIEAGVDVLDSDYAEALTAHGAAAAFKYEWDGVSVGVGESAEEEGCAGGSGIAGTARAAAAAHTAGKGFGGEPGDTARTVAVVSGDRSKLSLLDKRYALDRAPLVPGCPCFACAGLQSLQGVVQLGETKDGRPLTHPGHTRSYIHHLLVCHEILGSALLAVHNISALGAWMGACREWIGRGKWKQYKEWFLAVNGIKE